MSFALTVQAFSDGTKTVTRRNGWWNIRPGQVITGVVKSQGLKKGEKIQRLHDFIPTDVHHEPLHLLLDDPEYGAREMILEGFPELTPQQFVDMFLKTHKGTDLYKPIQRIEFVHCWPDN